MMMMTRLNPSKATHLHGYQALKLKEAMLLFVPALGTKWPLPGPRPMDYK